MEKKLRIKRICTVEWCKSNWRPIEFRYFVKWEIIRDESRRHRIQSFNEGINLFEWLSEIWWRNLDLIYVDIYSNQSICPDHFIEMQSPEKNDSSSNSNTTANDSSELLSNSNDSSVCIVCRTSPRQLALIPCGHFIVCVPCGHGLDTCPRCNVAVEGLIRVFM